MLSAGGLLFLIVIIVIIFKRITQMNPKVTAHVKFSEGDFTIQGRKNRFVVKKNADLEFLIQDGQIVAYRNLAKSPQYIYYGGVTKCN